MKKMQDVLLLFFFLGIKKQVIFMWEIKKLIESNYTKIFNYIKYTKSGYKLKWLKILSCAYIDCFSNNFIKFSVLQTIK